MPAPRCPSAVSASSWLLRTLTRANSAATKKPLRKTRSAMAPSRRSITPGGSHCWEMASANGTAARKTKDKGFMERMRAWHPNTRRAGSLPARFGHTRDEPARGELAERQARNLEPANKRPTAAADFATIDHPGRAGIAGKLGEGHVIFLRFELSPQGRVFFHGRALAFVAINPGRFRHKGTRKVARRAGNATALLRQRQKGRDLTPRSQRITTAGICLSSLDVGRWMLDVRRLLMFPLKTATLPSTATDLARALSESLRGLFVVA